MHPVLRDICVPNCFAWSPDGRVMYLSDSPEYSVRAYDFDGDSGILGAMRILHDDRMTPGRPDGGTVDTEGNLWVARPRGSCLARITPEGVVDQLIHVPATHPTACVFGGPDLRTLYITTARQRLTEAELAPQPMAGDLFAIELEVGGLQEPLFG